MRSSLGLSIAVALSLGGCIAEPRVQSAAALEPPAAAAPVVVAPAVKPPAVTTATATPPTIPPAVAASAVPAPVVTAPPALVLCGGSSAEEARCRRVIAQDMARREAAETASLRAVMKEVGIRQARLDDPGRPVRCTESAVDGRLVTTCAPSVLRP